MFCAESPQAGRRLFHQERKVTERSPGEMKRFPVNPAVVFPERVVAVSFRSLTEYQPLLERPEEFK